MPISRTVRYICDGCGKEIANQFKDRYQTITIQSHNYNNLMHDDMTETYVYCDGCSRAMWKAIRAIPRIVEHEESAAKNDEEQE